MCCCFSYTESSFIILLLPSLVVNQWYWHLQYSVHSLGTSETVSYFCRDFRSAMLCPGLCPEGAHSLMAVPNISPGKLRPYYTVLSLRYSPWLLYTFRTRSMTSFFHLKNFCFQLGDVVLIVSWPQFLCADPHKILWFHSLPLITYDWFSWSQLISIPCSIEMEKILLPKFLKYTTWLILRVFCGLSWFSLKLNYLCLLHFSQYFYIPSPHRKDL